MESTPTSPVRINVGTETNADQEESRRELALHQAQHRTQLAISTLPVQQVTFLAAVANGFMRVPSEMFSFLGYKNPFCAPVGRDDLVWLMDTFAYQCPSEQSTLERDPLAQEYAAELQIAVFEAEPKMTRSGSGELMKAILLMMALVDTDEKRARILERAKPFISEARRGRSVIVALDRDMTQKAPQKVGSTGKHGTARTTVKLGQLDKNVAHKVGAFVPKEVKGILEADVYMADAEGWMVLSDIDDTIKITGTNNTRDMIRETLVSEGIPVPGMPEFYAHIQATLPPDSVWCYIAASPHPLYPFLREFRSKYYPAGPLFLRDFYWHSLTGMLVSFARGTYSYKIGRVRQIHRWLPQRKVVMIRDSTQADPEVYGSMAREFPNWVVAILIRRVKDPVSPGIGDGIGMAEAGRQDRNTDERFENAFRGIPKEKWVVFDEAAQAQTFYDTIPK
ncbi:actin filament organization protein app1 [Ceratocystis lukuohia]|uniref:Actin filament organization protein app1 n=1 Tax=Ceratocystis lukuohia TaxID=2019550 RepID=A0ABR4MLT9_9PEZI